MHSQQAFSLLEMLITLTIASILAVISIPFLSDIFIETKSDLLRTQLLQTLQYARVESKILRQAVAVCKSFDKKNCGGHWHDGQLIFIDSYEDGIVHTPEQILAVREYQHQDGQLYSRSYPFYRDYILFLSAGMTHNDNATFWYCGPKKQSPSWAVVLSKNGKTREIYPNANGEIKDELGKSLICADEK